MMPPDFKTCREEELWHYVAWHLEGAGFNQALLVCRRQHSRVDFEKVAAWCDREGAPEAYEELVQQLAKSENPD